jgi:hypothetical protein
MVVIEVRVVSALRTDAIAMPANAPTATNPPPMNPPPDFISPGPPISMSSTSLYGTAARTSQEWTGKIAVSDRRMPGIYRHVGHGTGRCQIAGNRSSRRDVQFAREGAAAEDGGS